VMTTEIFLPDTVEGYMFEPHTFMVDTASIYANMLAVSTQ